MLVQAPTLPPLLCMIASKFYCLFTYKNGWDTQKHRSFRVPGSTKKVGQIVTGEKIGEIKWTDEFIEQYPALENFVCIRNEKGKIEFKSDEENVKITLKDALSAKHYAAGATWVFDNLIADTPLSKALNRTFGMYNVDKKILSLSYFLNISEGNAMSRYEPFADTHRLPWQRNLTPSAITRIFQHSITKEKIDKFFQTLSELTVLRDAKDTSTKYWALDSTSISTYSNKLALAEYGHNKDGDDTPQINVLMVVNQQSGEPVYFRTYTGNIPDVATVKNMLQEDARLKFDSNAVFVADKGYSSVINIHRFFQNKTSFLLNMRTSFSFCKNTFRELQTKLLDPVSYNEEIDNHVASRECVWGYPANFKTDCKKRAPRIKDTVYIHMYFNEDIYNSHKKTVTANIARVIKMLNAGEPLSAAFKEIKDRFIIETKAEGSKIVTYSTNHQAFDDYMLMKGIRVLISNEVKDPVEAYKAYFDRNEVEYAFNLYKQRLGCNRLRVSSNDALTGKTFVQFIATSIAIMFRHKVNNALKQNNKLKLRYDSESIIIDKLETIEQIKFSLGSYYTEVVGGLKELFKAMEIPVPSDECEQSEFESDTEANKEDEELEEIENSLESTYSRLE